MRVLEVSSDVPSVVAPAMYELYSLCGSDSIDSWGNAELVGLEGPTLIVSALRKNADNVSVQIAGIHALGPVFRFREPIVSVGALDVFLMDLG